MGRATAAALILCAAAGRLSFPGASVAAEESPAEGGAMAVVACARAPYAFEGYVTQNPADECLPRDARLPVVCCSPDGSACELSDAQQRAYSDRCSGFLTHSEAQAFCERRGRRLCRQEEIGRGVCCGNECGYDFNRVWTGDTCAAAPGAAQGAPPALDLQWSRGFPYAYRGHFVHVPKCGGTAMSSVLRRMMCVKNAPAVGNETRPYEVDCCKPGSCDPPGRKCDALYGCSGHSPRMRKMRLVERGAATQDGAQGVGSFTMIRNPVLRVLSAFYYRGHSPNSDNYHVRRAFCAQPQDPRCAGDRRYSLEDYLRLPEYHNIFVRMLSRNVFPYSNTSAPLSARDVQAAAGKLDAFSAVGIQEAYPASVLLLAVELDVPLAPSDLAVIRASRGRAAGGDNTLRGKVRRRLEAVAAAENFPGGASELEMRIEEANALDDALYEAEKARFCARLRAFIDLDAERAGAARASLRARHAAIVGALDDEAVDAIVASAAALCAAGEGRGDLPRL